MKTDHMNARTYAAGLLDDISSGEKITAADLFLRLTNILYCERRDGSSELTDAILSCFDEGARHALILGAAALRVMDDSEQARALKQAMAETFYDELRRQ